MRKMSGNIFKNIIAVSAVVLVSALMLILGVMYNYYSGLQKESLQNEAACIKNAYSICGNSYFDVFESKHRVTLINAEGTVLFDNTADSKTLENHLGREEVQEAIESGTGYSERYSSTISKKTVNIAMLLDDGNILRISDTKQSVFSLLCSLLLPVGIIMAAAIVLSFILAARVSKAITMPINKINLEQPEKNEVYEELYPLIDRISTQNEQIAHQMQELTLEHEKQDSLRRDFTANVSHELKTPLTSISGYAEIIRDGLVKTEDLPRFAGKIYDESQRLITLVCDIIKLSQLDGKDVPVKIEEIDLYEICEAVVSHLELAAKERNVSINLSGEHLSIRGAEQIVEEVIFNLCDNAVKYNKENGKVDIRIRQCVDGVELSVSDTGIGIGKEDIEHVFERFYRVDKSHSKEVGGTGLGLSIVKHGAKFMDAEVSIESEIDKGTTITILF